MIVSSAAAYRLWAPSYDTDPHPLLALEERITRDLLPDVASQIVVDVGCGTGRSMLRYAQSGALTFGADPSPEMLSEARRKRSLSKRVVQAEASHLPFASEIADVAVCSFAISYFEDLTESVSELSRVTKSAGRIVISDLHPDGAALGWTRSFRAGSKTYEIAHAPRQEEEVHAACMNAGLRILTVRDAGFGEPERAAFAAAGKQHIYSTLVGKPAVRVIVCRKI